MAGELRKKLDDFMTARLGESFDARVARTPTYFGEGAVDPFGLDPEWARYAVYVASLLHRFYFRTEVFGIENVPKSRVLVVANHSGQIPIDGMLLGASLFLDAEPPRIVRAMVEKWSQTLPFVSMFFPRVGQVVGSPENAKRLLEQGDAILVFPEGARGTAKLFKERYSLVHFGSGFMRLAMKMKAPIVPFAFLGGGEAIPTIANAYTLGRLLGVPYIPVTPWLVALPIPAKLEVHYSELMFFEGTGAEEDEVVYANVERVKDRIAGLIELGRKRRKGEL